MFTVTLELPESIKVAVGDTGLETIVPIKEIVNNNLDMARFAVVNGFIGALNNISRGKDESDKPNSDAVWASVRAKKVDVWLGGTWGATSRSEPMSAKMRAAWVDEYREKTSVSDADAKGLIKATVKEAFGDKEPATFARFLDALANIIAAQDGEKRKAAEIREALDEKYMGLAKTAAQAKAKVIAKLDVSAITI